MEKLVVEGSTRLCGEVEISGAKNAVVALLPATLLYNGIITLDNVPRLSDVINCCNILEELGAKIEWTGKNTVKIDARNVHSWDASGEITNKYRASYYLLGALLGRFNRAKVGLPGGCNLGARPIDQHIKGFTALGSEVVIKQGKVDLSAEKLTGSHIYLDIVSVGATINIMLASVLADGITIIDNAAKEPYIVDVANFLNTLGANIKGAGTSVIKIKGVKELSGEAHYSVVPDFIEAGTFMMAAVASRGDIIVKNCVAEHLEAVTAKILELGAHVVCSGDSIHVWCDAKPKNITVKTLPYPGFPTDMQSQLGVVLSVAKGRSTITESIWDSRFQYTGELTKMGANITCQGKTAFFEGVEHLYGCEVAATDLRAGAALLIAGIIAEGTTKIINVYHIDRGYEAIEDKFNKLGAKIKRIDE